MKNHYNKKLLTIVFIFAIFFLNVKQCIQANPCKTKDNSLKIGIIFGNNCIESFGNLEKVKNILGEPSTVKEGKIGGKYIWFGYDFFAEIDSVTNQIDSIGVFGKSSLSTESGIKIGDSIKKVRTIYGTGEYYSYDYKRRRISYCEYIFTFNKNGYVKSIEIGMFCE